MRTAEPIPEKVKAGGARRHRALVSLAGTLRRRGLNAATIAGMLRTFSEESLDPPAPDEDIRRIAESVTAYPTDDVPPDRILSAVLEESEMVPDGPVGTQRALSDFAPLVNEQLNQRAGRETKLAVARQIGGWLTENGRLLLDDETDPLNPQAYLLTDSSAAVPLSDELLTLRAALAETGLNPSEAAYRWLLADLQARAVNGGGRHVRLARYVVRRGNTLYVSCGTTKIVVAQAGQPLTTVANGTDGILFAADATFPTWTPTQPIDPFTLQIFRPTLESPNEAPGYTPRRQTLLCRAFFLSVLLGIRPKPSLAIIGPKGGGKSFFARALIRFLMGDTGDVSDPNLQDRDFAAAVTSLPIFAIDNLDALPPPWLSDAIATTVTGAILTRRRFFTEFGLLRRPITAALVVTTRTGLYAQRPDILDRTLPLFAGELPDNARRSEKGLLQLIADNRNGTLSYLCETAANLAPKLDAAPDGLPSRFQDFARIVFALDPEEALSALRAWDQARALSVTEPDQMAAAIISYLPPSGLRGSASEIVSQLVRLGAELPYLGGGKAIAFRLRELIPLLAHADIHIDRSTDAGGHTIWTLSRQNAEKPENAGVSNSYARERETTCTLTESETPAFSGFSAFVTGDCTPESLLSLAESRQWRRVRLATGTAGGDQTLWRAFARHNPDRLSEAIDSLVNGRFVDEGVA